MLIADVAVPVPLGRPFSYGVPAAMEGSSLGRHAGALPIRSAKDARRRARRVRSRGDVRPGEAEVDRRRRRRRARSLAGAAGGFCASSRTTTSRPSARCCAWRCRRSSGPRFAPFEKRVRENPSRVARSGAARSRPCGLVLGGTENVPVPGKLRGRAVEILEYLATWRRDVGSAPRAALERRSRGGEEAPRARARRDGQA